MLITANNDPSRALQGRDIDLLASCDDVVTYRECGWYCVIGYRERVRLVHAHAGSRDEAVAMAADRGYRWTEGGPVHFTPDEARAARSRRWGKHPYAA